MQTSLDAELSEGRPPGCRPPVWTEGMTDACEYIPLPQTSFAGGKYFIIFPRLSLLETVTVLNLFAGQQA